MIGPRVAVDNNVVDVSYRKDLLHTAQEHIHHYLEYGGTRGEPERQSAVLALTIRSPEAGLRSILLIDLCLVKPVAHVHDGEVARALEGGQNVVRARPGLLRDHDVLVNLPIVTTQPPGSRRLQHHNHG